MPQSRSWARTMIRRCGPVYRPNQTLPVSGPVDAYKDLPKDHPMSGPVVWIDPPRRYSNLIGRWSLCRRGNSQCQ